MPQASCSMAGPAKAPLKPATSSRLRSFASPRSILRTTLTVGNEGEGMGGQVASVLEMGKSGSFVPWYSCCLLGRKKTYNYLAVGSPTRLQGPTTSKDTHPFRLGPHGGLGSMEITAYSCAPAKLRAAGAARLVECRELGSSEAACRGSLPGLAAWSLGSSSEC